MRLNGVQKHWIKIVYIVLLCTLCSVVVLATATRPVATNSDKMYRPIIIQDKDRLTSFISEVNYKVCPVLRNEIAEACLFSSKKYHIPVNVIMALICVESTFDYTAISNKNAVGLMQVNYAVWLPMLTKHKIITCKQDLFIPSKNVLAGTYILKNYLVQGRKQRKSNPIKYALTRYYGGLANGHYDKTISMLGALQVSMYYKTKAL